MCFAIAISVSYVIPMTESADFINTSLVFATHGLNVPFPNVYIFRLQISYTNCVIGMSLGNIPIITLIGGIAASCQQQRPPLLQLLSEPVLALHNTLGIIKSFDIALGTNHSIVHVGKL